MASHVETTNVTLEKKRASGAMPVVFTIGVLVIAALVPLAVSDYRLFQFTMVMGLSVAVLGLNLLVGYSGQLSLGHAAFYAIGAYTTAICMDQWGVPYWLTIPLAGILCLAFGILFGIPALRLEGHYLALATFALALVLPQILKHPAVEHWTGGVQGIVLMKPHAPLGLPLSPDQWLYYFTLLITGLLFLVAWNIVRGRVGKALMAIRDQPIGASAMGVDVAYYKTAAFGISGFFTGVAGALSAITIQFVSPDSFNIFLSISFLVGVIVGGIATIPGALLGAIFIQFVPNLADIVSKSAPWAVYGACMIASVFLMPDGAVGLIKAAFRKLPGSKARAANMRSSR